MPPRAKTSRPEKAPTPPTNAAPTDAPKMIVASHVLIVSAPAGPRRRAGLSFGPVPRELTAEDLGSDPAATVDALRADPMLKIDGRFEEIEDEDGEPASEAPDGGPVTDAPADGTAPPPAGGSTE